MTGKFGTFLSLFLVIAVYFPRIFSGITVCLLRSSLEIEADLLPFFSEITVYHPLPFGEILAAFVSSLGSWCWADGKQTTTMMDEQMTMTRRTLCSDGVTKTATNTLRSRLMAQ